MGLQSLFPPDVEAVMSTTKARILAELAELDKVISRTQEQFMIDNNLICTYQPILDAIARKQVLREALSDAKEIANEEIMQVLQTRESIPAIEVAVVVEEEVVTEDETVVEVANDETGASAFDESPADEPVVVDEVEEQGEN